MRTCQMCDVEERGASWRVRLSGSVGGGRESVCGRWPLADQRSRVRGVECVAQLEISVLKRVGSGLSWRGWNVSCGWGEARGD